jgi:AraC-like DNA-binding protein
MPLHSLQDRIVALDCVDGDLHRSICGEARQNDYEAFMHALNRIFLLRIGERGTPPLAAHILSSVLAARGMARIGELARETGYSARHLNRVVADSVGMNLKLFSRIVRINAACRALSVPNLSLTALAQRFDYHDQAHFIHDFKSICGVAPGKFRSAMSHFYNEDLKLLGSVC